MIVKKENIEIRKLNTLEEYVECQKLQVAIWNFSEAEAVPYHQLLITQLNGGFVIGAFDISINKMIGFLYGVQGRRDNNFFHYSHMMGLLPEYRSMGIGEKMKLMQRDFTIEIGQKLILWTYDLLETPNGYLNISKLGGIVKHYYVNFYGEFEEGLSSSLPTDRFLVEWYIESKRVEKYLKKNKINVEPDKTKIITKTLCKDNILTLTETDLERDEENLLVELPSDIQKIKTSNLSVALQWRLKLRELFLSYFRRNYAVADFISESNGKKYYLLRKKDNIDIDFD